MISASFPTPEKPNQTNKFLLLRDQLNNVLSNGNAFQGFKEVEEAKFPPTYRKNVFEKYI